MPAGTIHVKALFEYASGHEDDLEFGVGQIISVTDEDDEEWYTGEYVDDSGTKHEGIFPRNFVEKYEPTAPPRPARRAKKDSEPAVQEESTEAPPPAPPLSPKAEDAPAQQVETPVEEPRPASPPARANPPPPAAPVAESAKASEPVSKDSTAQQKAAPPPVAAKSGSIRDRIAAFNKPGAAPVTPFKPSNLNYVKKPFVPPPPSRDAYVPPPRAEPPPRMYVREEEAEPVVEESETQESANTAASAAASQDSAAATDDQPKPTSLQERIAILQKQQAEAAQRHADAIAKKEKPKRPQKKRAESSEADQATDLERSVTLERRDTEDSERGSLDEPRVAPPSRRKISVDHPINDGNDADMSGAGDTTEGFEELTEREEDDKAQTISRRGEDQEEQAGEDEGEGEDEEVDPEVRRKEELRARMAKMSGGMGMPGMFMPMPGPSLPKKKKPSTTPKDETPPAPAEEPATSPAPRAAPPVPTMMALPGMSARQSTEQPRDEPEPAARPAPQRQSSIEEETGREDDDPTRKSHCPVTIILSNRYQQRSLLTHQLVRLLSRVVDPPLLLYQQQVSIPDTNTTLFQLMLPQPPLLLGPRHR